VVLGKLKSDKIFGLHVMEIREVKRTKGSAKWTAVKRSS